jgi:ATP-dependent DNA helicase PIF1
MSLTQKQFDAFGEMQSGKNIFLTGPGGSGKSFLLSYFINWYRNEIERDSKKIYITSTTGLSALLIDGMTINRYSGIGIGDKDVNDYYNKIYKMKNLKQRWINTGVLIIDEISMMDPAIFDKLETLARKIRKNEKPFGGIQVILSGDFLQLPPVKSEQFCFESFSWDSVIQKTYYFDQILRQEDPHLQNILNKIRVGVVDEEVMQVLNTRLNADLQNRMGIEPTILFSRKNMVEQYNKEQLERLIHLGNENYTFDSKYVYSRTITDAKKDYYRDLVNQQYQIEDKIVLTKNSQVMLNVNMPESNLANGSRGVIIGFTVSKYPVVSFLNGVVLEIPPKEYVIEEDKDTVKKIQIPLIHAWAITIHKAQGMSLELVKTDIGQSIFEYGQAYVVLSRIRNINGLSLINIDYSKIKAHPKILEFYRKLMISS